MQITKRSLYHWIFHCQYRLQFILLLVIITGLVFRVFPLEMQRRIVNQAITQKDHQLLFQYCGLYFSAVLLAGITKFASNYLQALIGQKILVKMRTELYQHILQLPLQFFRTMQPGTMISAMTAELNAIGFFIGGALAVPITSVLTYLALLSYMISVNPLLALLSTSFYPFELFIIPRLQKRYNKWNQKRIRTVREMSNVVNEAVTGIQDVQSYSGIHFEEKRLQTYIQQLYQTLKHLFLVKYGIKFTDNLFQSFGPLVLFVLGGYLTIEGQFTLGALVAFLSAYEKIYDPWKEMLAFYQSYQDAQVRYRQIMNIFDLQPIYALTPPERGALKTTGELKMKNVSYTLPNGTRLLNRINLNIHPGEQVAVVGSSGSGKSTMALLANQLYDATGGNILLNGHDIKSLTREAISDNITMISQKPFIFSGTIQENLLYGLESSSRKLPNRQSLFQLIRDVGLEEDIFWLGINSIIPEEQARENKHHFLEMRKIIRMKLGNEFSELVEFYDVNNFLYYASLRDNLIFGDSLDGTYHGEKLLQNSNFIQLLEDRRLERELLHLGVSLVRVTMEMVELAEDPLNPMCFENSPMFVHEFETYRELISRIDLNSSGYDEEKDPLLLLALRYIPAIHDIVPLPHGLKKKIFMARHYFLNQIMKIDVPACHAAGQTFLAGTHLPKLIESEQENNFIAYCSIRYLFHHNLRTNILFGSIKNENDDDVLRLRGIARKTFREHGLLNEVLRIGLNFNVGNQGSRLSGGQQQKIAIARGLLKETPILILDEATSGLDNISQDRIQALLTEKCRGSTTVIAIIHRLDLAHDYDRIVVLENGLIVEEGSYVFLMAQKGTFYALVKGRSVRLDPKE